MQYNGYYQGIQRDLGRIELDFQYNASITCVQLYFWSDEQTQFGQEHI